MIGQEIPVEKRGGIWDAIKSALKFTHQSAQGKYSLETYLEVLGEYTDDEIREFIASGHTYGGGEVVFSTEKSDVSIKAVVKMYFVETATGQNKMKKAERLLEKSMFTDEAVDLIEKKGEIAYQINAPMEG